MRDEGAHAGMRIGLFAHRLASTQPTGVDRYVRELVLALARTAEGQRLALASIPEPRYVDWVPTGVDRHVIPWPRRAVQLAWSLGAGPRLDQSLAPLSVAHLLQPFPPVRTSAPEVVTLHDLFPLEHPEWYSRSHGWAGKQGINWAVRRATRIVVPSRYVADRLGGLLGVSSPRVAVVPHGASGAFSTAITETEIADMCRRFGVSPGRFAVCVGAVSTRKNSIVLVQALAELGPGTLPLVMIGPDWHGADRVDQEIARLNGRARVLRTGYLPDATTASLVQGAAVLLHPALAEGFGFVPLEAMAAGTPVIAARVGAVPEVVGDAAVLVDPPNEAGAWAAAVKALLEDENQRATLSEEGLRRVARFSWDQTARRTLEVYGEAAETNPWERASARR
jgi:glycosyltransferase involved in cell wall biosynthesis